MGSKKKSNASVREEVTVYTDQNPEGLLFRNVVDTTSDSRGVTINEIVDGNSFSDFFPMHTIHRVEFAVLIEKDEEDS